MPYQSMSVSVSDNGHAIKLNLLFNGLWKKFIEQTKSIEIKEGWESSITMIKSWVVL